MKGKFPSRTLFAYSVPVYAYALIHLAQSWIDVPLMYTFTGSLQIVGLYYLVITGVNVISFIWIPIGVTILPAMSKRIAERGLEGAFEPLRVSTRLLNISVVPLGMALAAVAPTALLVAYGPNYVQGAAAFAFMAVTIVFSAHSYNLVIAIEAMGDTKPLAKIGIVSTIVEIAAMAALASTLGLFGGAVAKTTLYASSLLMSYNVIRKQVKFNLTEGLTRSIPFAVALAIPLYLVDTFSAQAFTSNLPLRVALDGVVFFALGALLARILRVFSKKEFELLRIAFPYWLHNTLTLLEKMLVGKERS